MKLTEVIFIVHELEHATQAKGWTHPDSIEHVAKHLTWEDKVKVAKYAQELIDKRIEDLKAKLREVGIE